MTTRNIIPLALLGSTALALVMPTTTHAAGFVADAKVTLGLRNYYFNRNFLNQTQSGQGQASGWTQSFTRCPLRLHPRHRRFRPRCSGPVLGIARRWSWDTVRTGLHSISRHAQFQRKRPTICASTVNTSCPSFCERAPFQPVRGCGLSSWSLNGISMVNDRQSKAWPTALQARVRLA